MIYDITKGHTLSSLLFKSQCHRPKMKDLEEGTVKPGIKEHLDTKIPRINELIFSKNLLMY